MRPTMRHAFCFIMALAVPMPALGWFGELPAKFTLSRGIPADAWMLIHGVANPERAWIEAQWNEVFDALGKSGIGKDLLGLAFAQMKPEDRTEAEKTINKALELVGAIDWNEMMAEEVVFAETLSPPIPAYYFLMRGKAGSGETNFKGIGGILDYIDGLSPDVAVQTRTAEGADIRSMVVGPYKIECFRKGDIIGLGAGTEPANDVLALLAGTAGKKSVIESARFKEALAQAKTPENEVMYFDFKLMLGNVNGLIGMAFQNATEDDMQGKKILDKVIAMCDVMDYGIVTTETDGQRDLAYSINKVQPDRMTSPLVRMCFTRKPFEKFDQFLPADTVSFSANGFIDVPLLYQTVIDFLEKEVPNGAQEVTKVKAIMAQAGFDAQRDFFDWWSGEMISVTMPAAVKTIGGGGDSVTMFRVKNAELARQKVTAGLTWLNNTLTQYEQPPFMMGPATVNEEGFVKLAHPYLVMMQVSPVVGVTGDWLMIASSESAVNRCLDVAAGKAPSIRENARFKAEGLIPDGPVNAVSFTDTSNLGQELASAVGGMGMAFGMMTAFMPNDPETQHAKALLSKLLGVVSKLGPVLAKIDFYSSEASITTVEGSVSKTKSVVTYKPKDAVEAPRKEPAKAPDAK